MKFQEWMCQSGCGHVFLLNKVSKSDRPHRPVCPNCQEKQTLIKGSIHEVDLTKTKLTESIGQLFLKKGN